MEFDKNKILTVVTADQAKVGQKGWFGNNMFELEDQVKNVPSSKLTTLCYGFMKAFEKDKGLVHYLFYPAPEPTYAERQAQWVKENNVKEGTKVRVTRTFTEDEDESCCWAHDDLVGMTGSVGEYGTLHYNLVVDMSDGKVRLIPYFALEVIKEPTYRPFANAKEYKPHRDEWVVQDTAVRRIISYNCCGVTVSQPSGEGYGMFITFETAFKKLKFENGEPFGVKE